MSGYDNYKQTDIQTSDPRAVVVLLYEGAIGFLARAHDAALGEDRQTMSVFIKKTLKIVAFLSGTLDHEQGEDISGNLDRLYRYMADTLNEANLHGSPEKIREVSELMKPLLEAWREVARDIEAGKALEDRRLGRTRPAAETEDAGGPELQAVAAAPQDASPPPEAPAAYGPSTDSFVQTDPSTKRRHVAPPPPATDQGLAAYGAG